MKSHHLILTSTAKSRGADLLYSARCALDCWSGTMTAREARGKQADHFDPHLSGYQRTEIEGMSDRPLVIDLFAGSFGWSQGWLELGGRVIGFDLEHEFHHGPVPRGADLVLQDVRTIDGARFKDASLILASSPCQEFSYRAMPWKRAKALGPPLLGLELFAQAFRIQREAIAAAGHFIPMVQENVRGANPWVSKEFGRSRWSYGSYHLWGDVPALMPITLGRSAMKAGIAHRSNGETNFHGHELKVPSVEGRRIDVGKSARFTSREGADDSVKCGGSAGDDWFTHHNRPEFEDRATKNDGGSWFNIAHNTESGTNNNPARGVAIDEGIKIGGGWFHDSTEHSLRRHSSGSSARKAASARIARIPLALSRHIARTYYPRADLPIKWNALKRTIQLSEMCAIAHNRQYAL